MYWTINESIFRNGSYTEKEHGRFETRADVTRYISSYPSLVHNFCISRWDASTGKIVEQTMAINWGHQSAALTAQA